MSEQAFRPSSEHYASGFIEAWMLSLARGPESRCAE
jgi:hypothetical protein